MLAAVDLKLVVAVISVIVSLLLFWFKLRSERRALTYRTVVDVPGERWAQFKVVYKDSTLSAPAFIHISILNSGRREIEVKDYEEPLTVLVSPAEVIEVSAAIGETAVSASISSDRHQVTLDKRLLNSQDRLTLHLLVENFDAKVVTVSLRPPRITGVKAVSKWDDGTAEKREERFIRTLVLFWLGIFVVVRIFLGEQAGGWAFGLSGAVMAMIVIAQAISRRRP